MFIFAKYFTDDEPLWKPAMKNRLGGKEYNEIADKIKNIV